MATPAVAEGTRVCYVYGVVPADRPPMLDGVAGVGEAPLSLVDSDRLVAVVADVARRDFIPPDAEREDTAWLERAVRAHEAVLERCLEPGPVLPMRFATTVRDDADVRALLREHQAEFTASLERLLGHREWGVKALLSDPGALAQHVLEVRGDLAARERELADRSPGAAYLARKRLDREIALAGDDLTAELVHGAHQRLAAAAAAACLPSGSQPRAERVQLNAAYLVAETDEAAFRAAVAELDREHSELGLRYELTGPWPAYNFVDQPERQ
jgi:Gas vesicle synthesis protein GvpL/GvpF